MEVVPGFLIHCSVDWGVSRQLLHQALDAREEFLPAWVILKHTRRTWAVKIHRWVMATVTGGDTYIYKNNR